MPEPSSPLITIIIPVFNSTQFIGQALESVFAQNYNSYELVVVDDGSTDDLQAALKPYRERICYLRQENAGSAAARNTGLDQALGEFIVFLDADDLMLPGKLRQQAAYLQLHPALGYVHSGWQQIDENGRYIRTIQPWKDALDLDLESWLQYKSIQLGAVMFRRIWLDRVGGLDPALRQSHDVDLMLRLSLVGCSGAWLFEPTISYRQYPASTMHRQTATQVESVLALLEKFFAYPDLPAEIQANKDKTYFYTTLWLAWYSYSCGNSQSAVPLLQQNLALASKFNDLPAIYTVVEWLIHFANWDRENGRSTDDLQGMWSYFQEAASVVQQWSELKRLLIWWLAQPDVVHKAYTSFDLWRIFQSGLDWEKGVSALSAELALSWWALAWQPYLSQSYTAAADGWMNFPQLNRKQLLYLVRFGLASEPRAVSTALLSQLCHDVQQHELPAAVDFEESAFFAEFSDLQLPKVSVIIPAFNASAYIIETIESVFEQTFTDYEVIVIDDGSTDGTGELLRPYHGQIRLISQENQGVSAARNYGLRLALGEYILFLDSDDLLKPDKLAQQVACLDADPMLGAVHSGWQMVDKYGRPIRAITPWQQASDLTLPMWLKWKPVFLGAMLFRRSWLERIEGFDITLRQAEDTDFLLRLSLAGCPMRWLETITVEYRQHGASVTQDGRQQAADLSRVLDTFFQNASLPCAIQQLEPDVRHFTMIWLVWQLYRTGHTEDIVTYLQQANEVGAQRASVYTAQSWLVQFIGYAREEGLILDELHQLFPYIRQALLIDEHTWPTLETMLMWWLTHWESLHQGYWGHLSGVQEVVYSALQLEQDGHIRSSVEWVEWWLKVWRFFLPHQDCGVGHEMQAFQEKSAAEIVKLGQASIIYAPERLEAWQIMVFWYRAQEAELIRPEDKRADTPLYLTYFGQSLLGKQWRRAGRALWRALYSSFHAQIGRSWRAWRDFIHLGIIYWRNGRSSQASKQL